MQVSSIFQRSRHGLIAVADFLTTYLKDTGNFTKYGALHWEGLHIWTDLCFLNLPSWCCWNFRVHLDYWNVKSHWSLISMHRHLLPVADQMRTGRLASPLPSLCGGAHPNMNWSRTANVYQCKCQRDLTRVPLLRVSFNLRWTPTNTLKNIKH